MPRPRSCPSCSARLPRDALYCQSCGRSIGFDLDVATVDEDEGDDQLPFGPEPSHRVRNVLIGVAVLAALAVGAVVVSRNDEPATTAATTTTAAPTSSGESTTTTTQPPYVERGGRPVLAVANGTVVYGLSREDQLVRLELQTGRTSFRTLDLNGEPEGWRLIPRTGGVLVVSYNESPLWVADGPEGVGVDLNLPVQGEVMPGPKPDELLVLDSNSYRSEQRLGIYRTDGTEVHPPVLLPAMSYYISDGAGGLLGFGGGHTYAIDLATGQPTLVAQQIVSGTSPAVLVEVACSVDYRCAWRVTDRATGAVRNLTNPPDASLLDQFLLQGPVSPDGRYVAMVNGVGQVLVIDLTTGASRELTNAFSNGYGTVPAWTQDGSWLFYLEGDRLVGWPAGSDGDPVRLVSRRIPVILSFALATAPPATS